MKGVKHLLISFVAALVYGDQLVIGSDFDFKDKCLDRYGFAYVFTGHGVPVTAKTDHLPAIDLCGYRHTCLRDLLRQRTEALFLFKPQIMDRPAESFSLSGIPLAAFQEKRIELGKIFHIRHGNQKIAPNIAHKILNATLLLTFTRIAIIRLEQEVGPECHPQRLLLTIPPPKDLMNSLLHVVVAYTMRDTLQIPERIYVAFKESFSSLGGQCAHEEFARIVQSHTCQMNPLLRAVHHHLCFAEVKGRSVRWMISLRNVTVWYLLSQKAHLPANRPFSTGESVFLLETIINPLGCVALF